MLFWFLSIILIWNIKTAKVHLDGEYARIILEKKVVKFSTKDSKHSSKYIEKEMCKEKIEKIWKDSWHYNKFLENQVTN